MASKKSKSIFKNKFLRFFLITCLLWVAVHVCYITWDGLKNQPPPSDIAVVLGSTVFDDGTPASWTKGRLDRAYELYKEGKVKLFFVSGGTGVEFNYPEATAMKAYLVKKGVPEILIVADNAGNNTYLSAVNFMKWNKESKMQQVIVVSQFFHITRTKYIFRKMGFKGELSSASSKVYTWKDMISLLREVPAFYKYALVY